ncbi:hypothetical protein KJY73_05630 [Bowmanella sp. Y26]|uniref:DUF1439 domain-containing protein n=1 Tax=Bowmanella yangjiangensis TaxID=2811230 RepID=A0ABS3CPJ7_9ALTE|nr:hypothetical protein [Bowmanella yangjiangensis]MBN7819019.1 hypothetical protein [Bowmanella yangjiangensis]MBT1063046.1 hypothetical protein [Bowmanella yangjiangensis]
MTRIKYWWITLLIRLGRLRHFSISATELNGMLSANLPWKLPLALPTGKGHLTVLNATVRMPTDQFRLELLCDLQVDVNGIKLYQAHVLAVLHGRPCYMRGQGSIRAAEVNLSKLQLIQDDHFIFRSSAQILSRLVPDVLGGWLNASLDVLGGPVYKEARSYLDLYLSGNKQKVLEFHQPQIERQLLEQINQGQLDYKLDDNLPDERLFARLGQNVKVEDGKLLFLFHD